MTEINRREFLNRTAAATAAVGLSSLSVGAAADDKDVKPVRVAVMGVNGRGRQLITNFLTAPEVEIAYICDPDSKVIPRAVKVVTDKGKPAPKIEKDFRVALDDPGVDVLICSAPDHWHALATILACQAGKDVYVEKPASHNAVEGQRMVQAARKYKRTVTVGMQRRSGADYHEAVQLIRDGKIGKVHFVRCWINSTRPGIGHQEVTEPPSTLDFNLWAGPGPIGTYKKNLLHYHWHWRWDYGTGECGNNGIHALDIARWGLGVEYPQRVICGGGKYSFDDDQETPDTMLATFDYPEASIQWEHRTWSPSGIDGEGFGITFYGTKGTLYAKGGGWSLYEGKKLLETREPAEKDAAHVRNFLDCRESHALPNADIEIGHKSALMCHLANIAWRTRSAVDFDAKKQTILGVTPEFGRGRVVGGNISGGGNIFLPNASDRAASLLTRTYRKGFELPAIS